ncbi:ankyrin repeat protein [Colletotrichum kahawae]|uniref:Ankyrin repeat protein n=1 Tax=Colletotrichum kahawae TaxID=34407 RepID=A0AAE0DDT9_COLKA|nr:ankyrin repeat protein [Colletotrichum kahawae]
MLRKLKTKLGKRTARNRTPESDPNASLMPTPQSERYGMFHVAESPFDPKEPSYPVDIIAVHGLNGDAFTTWTHSNGTLWLRDLLPKALPGCRVYTYGYPSQIVFNASYASIQEYSRGLLTTLKHTCHKPNLGQRSIIFVCHSLGGLVCKQALVFAHEDDADYDEVLQSVSGIVFLGTPHRGSSIANLGSVVGNIINTFLSSTSAGLNKRMLKTDLLDFLKQDGKALQDLSMSVRNRLGQLKIVSCYETEPTPPLSSLVVDRISATMGIPNESIMPIYQNHRDLCRFAGETSSYKMVFQALHGIALDCQPKPARLVTSIHSSDRSFSESEKNCMTLLRVFDVEEYRLLLPKPTEGTCQWILNHPLFASWNEKTGNHILWLMGHPGCGKTTMSFFVADHFEKASGPLAPSVYIYFCDDKVNRQRDGKNILIGLIFQILCRQRKMIRHAKKVFDQQGASMIQSFSALWGVFENMLKDPNSGSALIIVDALDECEDTTCRQLINSIHNLVRTSLSSEETTARVKFFLTSRPALLQTHALDWNDTSDIRSSLSVDDSESGYRSDLQAFIRSKVEDLSRRRNCPAEVREFLLQALSSRVGHTFLWIDMILAALEESLLVSVKDFQEIVTRIPPDLESTYARFLAGIPRNYHDTAQVLLQLLLASSRPLTLEEINTAFTIRSDHQTSAEISQDSQNAIALTIQGILGPLIRISDNRVALIHQTAKEFLLRPSHLRDGPFPMSETTLENSSLRMASACVSYLLLDDFSTDLAALVYQEAGHPASGTPSDEKLIWLEELAEDVSPETLFREPAALDAEICSSVASKYPFYRYASLHWASHLAECETIAPDELMRAAERLLDTDDNHCGNWLRFFLEDTATAGFSFPSSLSPLALASTLNLHELVNNLLKKKKNPSKQNLDQALFLACQAGNLRIVSRLLEEAANPNLRVLDRQTALTVAAERGQLGCINVLLAQTHTNVNTRGRGGRTALSFACGNGYLDMVDRLLDRRDCKVDEADNAGSTPLFWAVGGGHLSVISTLATESSADINHLDRGGRTVTSWAAGDGLVTSLREILKIEGAQVNLTDAQGRSPLSWAAGNGHADAVRLLLRSRKVDAGSVDLNGRNAFSWASARGHLGVLRVLLRYGCPGIDDKDVDGWTPLAWAIQNDCPEFVDTLLSTGSVDVEHRDNSGKSILCWAVSYGHISVVKVLLRFGADPSAASPEGVTAKLVAEASGRVDISAELSRAKKAKVSASTSQDSIIQIDEP